MPPLTQPKFLGTNYIRREFDGKPCPYCERVMMSGSPKHPTRDHIVPKAKGGTLENDNCLVVCLICNGDKADMTLPEFAAWLARRGDRRAPIVAGLANITSAILEDK